MARQARPPIIAVMGHIDHGKSSLLDYIRKANVVAGEAGGITQHVAAYVAEHNGRAVTFLDTPGHEAFKALRARGAQAADIAILVVAADEGVMPQTLDALAAITEAKIPFVVALTKIDKNNADLERAKNSLLEHGVYLEGLGGEVPYAAISSKSGVGIPELWDLVLLSADLVGLVADPEAPAEGFVLESTQDSKRGASATLILKDGTLATGLPGQGSFVVAGDAYAPVRFIENFLGKRVDSAGPSEPVRISGFSKLPPAGTPFLITASKKEAEKRAQASAGGDGFRSDWLTHSDEARGSKEDVTARASDAELALVVKADVQGSLDAILHEIKKLSHEHVAIALLASGVGAVSESDVKAASAAHGVIIAFSVGTDAAARDLALRDGVTIESFTVIYELSKKISELLILRAPRVMLETELGRGKVLKTFSSGAKRQVLGVRYLGGVFALGRQIKILRREIEIARGKILNLQIARANVEEIRVEGDFGVEIEAREDAAPGDEIVVFALIES
ncbi:translation initiation factor IF-2 [Candidatus Kaiserbacteria bacterium]|nr:translation initiation factor IF-2 [Candidatus Kaiserbacteria bacterium]